MAEIRIRLSPAALCALIVASGLIGQFLMLMQMIGLNGAFNIAGLGVAVSAVLFSYAVQDARERDRDGIWRRRWFWWAWDREAP